MANINEILKKWFGYSSFRENQEEIIQATLKGQDLLAILPTGGGKSLCYQVPALANEGLCLVVSPLIALMKDQVDNLKKKNIKALYLHGNMSAREEDIALDNCVYGNVKFLFVSPERVQNRLFQERFQRMTVNLIAVDEAHCISQWGHDFRPAYQKLPVLRTLKPGVPIMALTATATPQVELDILNQLELKAPQLFRAHVYRDNLSIQVHQVEDKLGYMMRAFKRYPGPGIVYCSTRKEVIRIAEALTGKGITTFYYHGGLKEKERSENQEAWIQHEKAIMVATNAFGMGIDKPDVRLIVHSAPPASLEDYYQEIGRAGRDGLPATTLLFWNTSLQSTLVEQFETREPDLDFIRNVYKALGNQFQLAFDAGLHTAYPLDIHAFCQKYNLPFLQTYHALEVLELEGYLELRNGPQQEKCHINSSAMDLYNFQLKYKRYDQIIQALLRNYPGIQENYKSISTQVLSAKSGFSAKQIKQVLMELKQYEILDYVPVSKLPEVYYLQGRKHEKHIKLSKEFRQFAQHKRKKLDAFIGYAERKDACRQQLLGDYFGTPLKKRCGQCDFCKRHVSEKIPKAHLRRNSRTPERSPSIGSRLVGSPI